MRQQRHVARIEEKSDMYNILAVIAEERGPFGKSRHKWEDNINMDLKEILLESAGWIHLVQDRIHWGALLNRIKRTSEFRKSWDFLDKPRGYSCLRSCMKFLVEHSFPLLFIKIKSKKRNMNGGKESVPVEVNVI
jgi:hypothetical protein